MSTKVLFALMAVFAFGSVISFFQIDSYWADQHHFNGIIGWLGIGIVLGLVAIYFLYRVIKQSGTGSAGTGAR